MNPPTLSPRDARPADRPPPRDPQAAGAPKTTSKAGKAHEAPAEPEAAFKALVDEAKGQDSPTQPDPAALPRDGGSAEPSKAETDEKPPGDGTAETKAGENIASAPPIPVLAQPQPPVPPATMPARDQSAARETAKGQKNAATPIPAGVDGIAKKEAANVHEPQDGKPHAAKPHADLFAAMLQDSQTRQDAQTLHETPPLPSTPAMTRSLDPAPSTPPLPTPPPVPIVALPATIALKALEGSNQFQIRLDPEDLGRIDVSLEIKSDGSLRAAIAADNPDALQLIVREARSLEQAFDQAGFRRDDQALSFSLSDQQQQSSEQRQGRASQQTQQVTRLFVEGDAELPASFVAYQQSPQGRLDVRI